MAAGEYLTGLGLLALVVGAAILMAIAIVRSRLAHLAGVERWLAGALLATALLIAMHLLPAILGILDRWVVAALAVFVLALAIRARRAAPVTASEPRDDRESRLSQIAAVVLVAALAVYALAVLGRLHETLPTFIDTVTFHLPGAVRWIQSDSIWQIDQFLPGQAQGYYPTNGNVVELAALLPWHSEFAIRLVNLPFYALTGLALYATGRELAAPRTSAVVAAAGAIAVPAVTSYIVDSPTPDAVMYATFATGIFFLVRHARSGARVDLLLAGLGLGLAFGSRWYGVTSVAVVVVVWLAAQTVARRWTRALAVDALLMVLVIAGAGGIWLVRNWVEVGDPVFPVQVSLFGLTIFDAPPDALRDLAGFSIAHYFDDGDVLSDFVLPALKLQIGYVGVLFAAAAVAAIPLAIRRRRRDRSGGPALALAVAALGLAVAYTLTPYTALGLEGQPYELGANVRYLIPALLAAAPALAWVLARSGRARPWLEVAVAVIALDALRRGVDVSIPNLLEGIFGVALIAAAVGALWWAWRRSRLAAVAVTSAVALVVTVALYAWQRQLLDDRYLGYTPAVDAALARAPAGAKIGVAGAWPVTTLSPIQALFGTGFDNDVEYVGRDDDGFLIPYETSREFGAALDRAGYDLVLVGQNPPIGYPQLPEGRWAEDAGYRRVAADENFTLFAAS